MIITLALEDFQQIEKQEPWENIIFINTENIITAGFELIENNKTLVITAKGKEKPVYINFGPEEMNKGEWLEIRSLLTQNSLKTEKAKTILISEEM